MLKIIFKNLNTGSDNGVWGRTPPLSRRCLKFHTIFTRPILKGCRVIWQPVSFSSSSSSSSFSRGGLAEQYITKPLILLYFLHTGQSWPCIEPYQRLFNIIHLILTFFQEGGVMALSDLLGDIFILPFIFGNFLSIFLSNLLC